MKNEGFKNVNHVREAKRAIESNMEGYVTIITFFLFSLSIKVFNNPVF